MNYSPSSIGGVSQDLNNPLTETVRILPITDRREGFHLFIMHELINYINCMGGPPEMQVHLLSLLRTIFDTASVGSIAVFYELSAAQNQMRNVTQIVGTGRMRS